MDAIVRVRHAGLPLLAAACIVGTLAGCRSAYYHSMEMIGKDKRELLASLHRVERQLDPVLATFRDQVLYLKHNLNARAIGALDDTEAALRREVGDLIDEMEAAITEAERFIDAVQAEA